MVIFLEEGMGEGGLKGWSRSLFNGEGGRGGGGHSRQSKQLGPC